MTPKGSDFPATRIPLPKLKFPTFDGKFEEWGGFYNLFSSTIGDNHYLTPVQKFLYLRSLLTGKAADCVNVLPISDANYITAIAILKDRFEHPRYVALKHSHAIVQYPKVSKQCPTPLWHLICSISQNLCSLKNLGEQTNINAILISLISSKLPANIIKQWELTLPNKEVPHYTHLLDFLKNLALIFTPSSEVSTTRGSSHRINPIRSVNVRDGSTHLPRHRLRWHVQSAEDHTPFGNVTTSRLNQLASALRTLQGHPYASITWGKDIQCKIVTPDYVIGVDNGITRCYIGLNTTQELIPQHSAEPPFRQTVDSWHPPHHLVIGNLQQTTNRRHHERTRPQLHPPAIDEHINSDADNRRFQWWPNLLTQ